VTAGAAAGVSIGGGVELVAGCASRFPEIKIVKIR
jgi:hypothetical protein